MALRTFPALFFLLASYGVAHAEGVPCLERTIAVSLSRSDGTPVASADSLDLQGAYGNHAVTIRSIKPAERLPRVVLLIDTSGSMETSEPAAAVLAERLVSRLPLETEVGLAFFDAKYTPMVSLGKDRPKLAFLLEALKNHQYYTEGHTALWTAVAEAAKLFGTPSLGDTIYVISDGGDNLSQTQMRGVLQGLAGSGIRLFAAVLADSIGIRSRTPEELYAPGIIKEAVRTTGGALLFDTEATGGDNFSLDMVGKDGKPTPFAEHLNRQVSQLLNFYQLEVSFPEPIRKPQPWRLHIVSDARSPAERIQLVYPSLLMPCR